MEFIWDGVREAFNLWIHGDGEIISITLRTLAISSVATVVALLIGVPVGAVLALKQFPGRSPLVALVNTRHGHATGRHRLSSSPSCSGAADRSVRSDLIFTPTAIVIAQFLHRPPTHHWLLDGLDSGHQPAPPRFKSSPSARAASSFSSSSSAKPVSASSPRSWPVSAQASRKSARP